MVRRTTASRRGHSRAPTYIEVIDTQSIPRTTDTTLAEEATREVSYKSLDEVPRDLEGLSVDEVAECLCLLRIGHVAPIFLGQQIDGSLLKTLGSDALKTDMKLNDFECTKLMKFIHDGWRPNLTRRKSSVSKKLENSELSLPAESEESEDTKL